MSARILIAGGGVGGLCAALCLLEHGFDVQVLEAAAELREVGAGIQLSPNAMRVMRALGLEDALHSRGFRPDALEARMGRSGRRIFRIELDEDRQRRWGAPYLHIHRAALVDVLRRALVQRAPGVLRLGAGVTGFAQTDDVVEAELRNGETVRGDALLGADGIHSVIARHICGDDAARFTGNVAWRAVVPIDRLGAHAPDPTACVWMGEGRHAVTYRLDRGRLANFVGVVERGDWTAESWTEPGPRHEALADFEGWHPVVTTLIARADTLHRWALFDRPPRPQWVEGRVALLGDAAHPMLPFMAQGAAQAIEDGWVVARALQRHDSVGVALRHYAANRQARTARVQAASRGNMGTFHRRSLAAKLATYGPMWLAGRVAPEFVAGRQDWIYGHDVTR